MTKVYKAYLTDYIGPKGVTFWIMEATLERGPDGELIRKAGIMGVVLVSGEVRPGDSLVVEAPQGAFRPLAPV